MPRDIGENPVFVGDEVDSISDMLMVTPRKDYNRAVGSPDPTPEPSRSPSPPVPVSVLGNVPAPFSPSSVYFFPSINHAPSSS